MTPRLAMGIDVSTAELRVFVIDAETGDVECETSVRLPAPTTDGPRREQDADYGRLALEAVDAALAYPLDGRVASVAVTATSGTVVPVDDRGRQVGAAALYDDARATRLEPDLAAAAAGRPIAMLARMAALAAERAGFRAASVAQVIATTLVGTAVAGDTSHFLKAGVDPATGRWADDLLRLSGLDRGQVPDLVEPGAALGTVACGEARGAVIVAGMSDGCTSQLATGAVTSGQSVGVVGTTLVVKVVSATERLDPAAGVYSHLGPDGAFWAGGASNVGGGSFALPPGLDYPTLDAAAAAFGPSPLVTYPLVRRGERFPVADPAFEAFGVDLSGHRRELPAEPVARYRAVMEGVALVERLSLETLGIVPEAATRILSGGATQSGVWNAIRAATLGVTVRTPAHRDSGFGAAVLAAWAAGDDPFGDVVARLASGGRDLDPEPALIERMRERYEVFTRVLALSAISP